MSEKWGLSHKSRKIGPFIYFLLKKGGQSYTWQCWKRGLFCTHIRTMPYIGSYPHPQPPEELSSNTPPKQVLCTKDTFSMGTAAYVTEEKHWNVITESMHRVNIMSTGSYENCINSIDTFIQWLLFNWDLVTRKCFFWWQIWTVQIQVSQRSHKKWNLYIYLAIHRYIMILGSGQRRPWSDCAYAQSDQGPHCPHRPRIYLFPMGMFI